MDTPEGQLASLSPAKRALLDRLRQQAAARSPAAIRKRANPGPAPASFAQQRLWLVHQLDPESHLFNVPRGLRLQGPLDIPALERAINEIVRRHEVLRTVFTGDPTALLQQTADLPPVTLEPIGILPEAAIQHGLEEFSRPFDLATGPLLRARLWRAGPEDHFLLIVMHHIVSDAWTAAILFNELAALYGAFSRGLLSPLPELPVQYADYAVWQRESLSGERLRAEIAWWTAHLQGAPPELSLQRDFPRPAAETSQGAQETIWIPTAVLHGLREIAAAEGATLYMSLLAAFSIFLSRYSNSHDIVLGADFSNRAHVETEKLIGFFINLLPIRIRLQGNPTFRRLIGIAKDAALAAYAHPELPFEKLVEELKPERAANRHPIVQVLLVMQNIPRPPRELAGLRVSEFALPVITSKFDLVVFLEETPEGLCGQWVYSARLWKPETIQLMARHFETLIGGALANPEARIDSLRMYSEKELREREEKYRNSKQIKSQKLRMTSPAGVGLPALPR